MSTGELDVGLAKQIVALAIAELKKEENEKALREILDECEKLGEENQMAKFQLKMQKLIPKVMEILGAQIAAVTGEAQPVMNYVMQIQKVAASDIHLGIQVKKIIQALSGDFSGLYEQDLEDEEVEHVD